MASIYIRDLDDALVRGIRSKAALAGKTLKEYMAPFLQLALDGKIEAPAKTQAEKRATERLELPGSPKHAATCKCGICKPKK